WPMMGHDAQHSGVYTDPIPPYPGDVNTDGIINAADIVSLQLMLSGQGQITPQSHNNAMITDDLVVDDEDLQALIDLLLGR
ncbi:hypothetical protein JXA47_00305, partial [Candidatus Sumerlaeota bacterium]|nr:hypothetical protein [Candidatus Sumerlaeota bacterium]